jgi:hypothetical protein
MGEYADESVVDVASSATMVRMVIIQKCFVLWYTHRHPFYLSIVYTALVPESFGERSTAKIGILRRI